MKERGSDREKGSAKSCQPEIKQAGTLPIPKPQHPPQSHILPLHSLYLSPLPPSSISLFFSPLPLLRDIFKPRPYSRSLTPPYIPSYLRHYLRLTADLVSLSPRVSVWCSFNPLLWGQTMPLFIVPVALSSVC